jgi:hypothetical protein
MSARSVAAGLLLMPLLGASSAAIADDGVDRLTASQAKYILGCGGCHGIDGVSNSRLVPDLRDQVGFFFNSQAGRDYLVRVPNVAFYSTSDQDLTDILNFMVFQLGRASIPAGAKPYANAEVARLRKRPLNETSLVDYRRQLIESLSVSHAAPGGIYAYGSVDYQKK